MEAGRTYYNEIDPFAAQWLRNLIAASHLPAGEVDERSIVDVQPADLKGFTQCHFFAGIGGWPLALKLAGWPDDREVWTGSCPCQPLSAAGQRKGHADERHLWPAFHALITECRPPTVFGEQVASSDGREWFAGIRADLEDVGYACGGADLCAAGVGAPHIRQRIFWVAQPGCADGARRRDEFTGSGAATLGGRPHAEPGRPSAVRGMADAKRGTPERHGHEVAGAARGVASSEEERQRLRLDARDGRDTDRMAHPNGRIESNGRIQRSGQHGFWSQDAIAISCTDGKRRRVPAEPSFQPLAHGVPGRLGQLRAYGNAIVPQVGAAFVTAFLDAQKEGAGITPPQELQNSLSHEQHTAQQQEAEQ